ncbi:MAG: helix-turn-helix transcriptional regulator [Clostridia bacterium]|nr:helix-turn-helix transcriptional regulator [Clostridia bacterium]
MKIIKAGYNHKHSNNFVINRPVGSGDYVLIVIRSSAFFYLDGIKKHAEPNSVVIYKKGTPQIYGADGAIYINDWLHFELEQRDLEMFSNLGIPFDTILSIYDVTQISGFIKKAFYELCSENKYKDRATSLYLELILLKLSERLRLSEFKRENRYYDEFCSLRNDIYSKPDLDWNIDEISKKMNLSRSYVQHLYKEFFNESIIIDVVNSRIEYAKYLLTSTDMTIGNIASVCGYKNEVHFMRMFKQRVGSTPSKYRSANRIPITVHDANIPCHL